MLPYWNPTITSFKQPTSMNKLAKIVHNIYKLPTFMQQTALSYTIGNVVKFVGTAGIRFEEMSTTKVALSLKNKRKVQNHIGQVHAAATALLAETATGMVVGMNLPDDKIPLLQSMLVQYTRRSQGQQSAIATLSEEAIQTLHSEEKGNVEVPVTITDETGAQVVEVIFRWAWIPKKKKKVNSPTSNTLSQPEAPYPHPPEE